MINFEEIKKDFIKKFGAEEGIVSIDLTQNLIRVLLLDDSYVNNLPATFLHEPQNFEIGIEYDSLPRQDARAAYAEKIANIEDLLEAVVDTSPI